MLTLEEHRKMVKSIEKKSRGFEPWIKKSQEEEKKKTHGAEPIDWDDPLYVVRNAINRRCFNNSLPFLLKLYYMPKDLAEKYSDAMALYGYGTIMIRQDYYEKHGMDDVIINMLFHEMVHAYCGKFIPEKRIKNTDGDYHLPAFKEVCEANGGICNYTDDVNGFSDARLTAANMKYVKDALERAAQE